MGSPLGPTLANVFMGCIGLKVVPAFKNSLLYLRYVDDCFVLVRNEKIMDNFFNVLNNAHDSINFTIEKEKNYELAFLDVQIKQKENRFLTSVQRKKTFTECYLNFQSNCCLKRKVNLIRTLSHRAHKICSQELLLSEIKQIKILYKNSYPQELVNKTIHLHVKNLDRIKTIGPE